MLTKVELNQKLFGDYFQFIDADLKSEIFSLAKRLKGQTIAYVSATSARGGVAELISAATPIFNDLGLDFSWYTLPHITEQFLISRQLRDMFQGESDFLAPADLKKFLDFNKLIAEDIDKIPAQTIVISDYQPLVAPIFCKDQTKKFIWQFHLDFFQVNKDPKFIDFLVKYLAPYAAYIFNTEASLPSFLSSSKKAFIIPPAIDPLKAKNRITQGKISTEILRKNNINLDQPIILQVSRFNIWKNHQGVLDAFLEIKKKLPTAQLVFVSHLVNENDLEQVTIYQSLLAQTKEIPDVHFVVTTAEHNDSVVSALQSVATIIVQNSSREGFGLTVTEAMWKQKAVVGGFNSGIMAQIDDGINGFIAKDAIELSHLCLKLLNDKDLREKIGQAAHQKVAQNFLLPHFILNYLRMLDQLLIN